MRSAVAVGAPGALPRTDRDSGTARSAWPRAGSAAPEVSPPRYTALSPTTTAVPPHDVHAHAHLGAVDAALAAAEAMLWSAAAYVDALPHDERAELIARRVRAVVEHAVDEAITRTGRALGPTPLALDGQHAQRVADLTMYVRQSHAERDLAALGPGGGAMRSPPVGNGARFAARAARRRAARRRTAGSTGAATSRRTGPRRVSRTGARRPASRRRDARLRRDGGHPACSRRRRPGRVGERRRRRLPRPLAAGTQVDGTRPASRGRHARRSAWDSGEPIRLGLPDGELARARGGV